MDDEDSCRYRFIYIYAHIDYFIWTSIWAPIKAQEPYLKKQTRVTSLIGNLLKWTPFHRFTRIRSKFPAKSLQKGRVLIWWSSESLMSQPSCGFQQWSFSDVFKEAGGAMAAKWSCYFEFSVEKPTNFYGDFIVMIPFFLRCPTRNFQRHPGRCSAEAMKPLKN